jgi:hypothetical protein
MLGNYVLIYAMDRTLKDELYFMEDCREFLIS